jgi:hypothetical protein
MRAYPTFFLIVEHIMSDSQIFPNIGGEAIGDLQVCMQLGVK